MSQGESPERSSSGTRLLIMILLFAGGLFFADRHLAHLGTPPDDLVLAEQALDERDMGDAEMYLERYLRKNPSGERRWEVWNRLLSIALDVRQDKATAREYLEIMLGEFFEEPERRRQIKMQLAELSREAHAYERAAALWESLASDPEIPTEDLAAVYRNLSQSYLRRLEFSHAVDILGLCLDLSVSNDTKADCLYTLAEAKMLTEELPGSQQALEDLLLLPDISQDRRVLSTFMLADVMEQQEKYAEALELFESIRDSYPNSGVLDVRLQLLLPRVKKTSAPKPDVVPAPGYQQGR